MDTVRLSGGMLQGNFLCRLALLFVPVLIPSGGSAQITQSGKAVLKVPVAGREMRAALSRVEKLFKDNRLEEGYSALRRLFVEGEHYLFPVSDRRYVAGDIKARSFLLSLTEKQRSACRRFVEAFALKCENRWRREGDKEAFDTLRRELIVTDPGRRALSRYAETLFEKGFFNSAAETWHLLASLEGGKNDAFLRRGALAYFLAGNTKRFSDGRQVLENRDASKVPAGRLAMWCEDYASYQKVDNVQPYQKQVSVFDVSHRVPSRAPFMRKGITLWRTVGGLWPAGRQTVVHSREQGILHYAVPFRDRVYATSGYISMTEFDMETGKLLHRFRSEPDPSLKYLAQHIERNPRTVLVTDKYVIGTFTVKVSKPSRYRNYAITEPVPLRAVFVFSRTGRRLLWRSDRIAGLEGLHAVGMPLLRGDILYIPGWRQKGFVNLYTAAVNVHTGEMVWKSVICGSQVQATMFGEMAVEPFGITLAASRELLFAATHMGAVAALRRSDGRLRWLTQYESKPVTVGSRLFLRFEGTSWYDNPLFLHGSRLIVAPRDCSSRRPFFLVLEAGSGKHVVRKRVSKESMPVRYLLGIRDGRLYCAGERSVQAFSLQSSRQLNVFNVKRHFEKIVGRPALTQEGIYYCKVTVRRQRGVTLQSQRRVTGEAGIYFYSFSTGKSTHILRSSQGKKVQRSDDDISVLDLGNITVTGNGILVSSPYYITYYGEMEKQVP